MKHMNEYEKQARDFLKNSGAKMTISAAGIVQGFPFEKKKTKTTIINIS